MANIFGEELNVKGKFRLLRVILSVAAIGMLAAPNESEAIPSFARQMGVPCFACHYQHIPKLNSFGREFKLGGFTQIAQDTINDDGGFSLPSFSNISLITHFQYAQDTKEKATTPNKVGTERGEWGLPNDAALWIGGRLGENFGYATELPGPIKSPKIIFSKDFGGVRGGVVVGSTDAMGTAYSMELFNTGAVQNHRDWDMRNAVYVQQALGGPAAGQTTGVHFFAGSSLFFANVGLFGPASITAGPGDTAFCGNGIACGTGGTESGTSADAVGLNQTPGDWGGWSIDSGFNLSIYYRFALTPKIADGVDFMVGVQGTAGSTKATLGLTNAAGTPVEAMLNTNTLAFDTQVQTDISGMSLEVTAAYQTNASTDLNTNGAASLATATSFTYVAPGYTNGGNGFDINAALAITKALGVHVAYLNYTITKGMTNGTTWSDKGLNAVSVGLWYNILQNANLELSYTKWGGDLTDGTNGNTNDKDNQLMLHLLIGI